MIYILFFKYNPTMNSGSEARVFTTLEPAIELAKDTQSKIIFGYELRAEIFMKDSSTHIEDKET